MPSFAIFAEGPTDQPVIENVLVGVYGSAVDARYVQPKPGAPGGWTLVFASLRAGEVEEALSVNDYAIIQIDTDVCDDIGFDVVKPQPLPALIEAVRERLIEVMGERSAHYAHRVFFAICVHSLECWLLPLLQTRRPKRSKIEGCEAAANQLLRRANAAPLSKNPNRYRDVSAPYRKAKNLQRARQDPSLAAFLDSLPR